jgi:uncharacterized protein YciI
VPSYLIRSRASAEGATAGDDPGLNERHWSYMDGYGDAMTARGPTLGPDRDTWTGSMHVVQRPGDEAVSEFVQREPYQLAGLYAEHAVWRFTNLLGRTMWEFAGPPDEPRFLVLAVGGAGPAPLDGLPAELRDRLVLYGELDPLDDGDPGVALAVQAPDRAALDVLLAAPGAGLTGHRLEVHDWEFGGRR